MDNDEKRIPRMRTAAGIVAELKTLDPDTGMTEFHVRQLAKEGAIPVVWAGRKALMDLNAVLDLMRQGTSKREPEPETVGGIRRIDARRPVRKEARS